MLQKRGKNIIRNSVNIVLLKVIHSLVKMEFIRFYFIIIFLIFEKCDTNEEKNLVLGRNVNPMLLENYKELLARPSEYDDLKRSGPMTQDICNRERKSIEACQKYRSKYLRNGANYIIGGEEADLDEFPYMVALGYFIGNNSYKFGCGGSLISTTYVLTAAHCIQNPENLEVKIVRIGITIAPSVTRERTTYDHKVEKLITHGGYDRRRKLHDIALIQLHRSVDFRKNVKPLCLYTKNDDPEIMEIVGWGETNFVGRRDANLLKAVLSPVDRHTCEQVYGKRLNVKIESCHICAGNHLTNICKGDSGGPLLTKGRAMTYQVGVIVHGEKCGSRTPGLYARVSSYLNWIEDIVWSDSYY